MIGPDSRPLFPEPLCGKALGIGRREKHQPSCAQDTSRFAKKCLRMWKMFDHLQRRDDVKTFGLERKLFRSAANKVDIRMTTSTRCDNRRIEVDRLQTRSWIPGLQALQKIAGATPHLQNGKRRINRSGMTIDFSSPNRVGGQKLDPGEPAP